jgi:hypothetical protein
VNHLAALAGVGFEERGRGGDDHAFGHLSDGHRQVDAPPRGDLHLHVVHERDREAAFLGGDEVDTDRTATNS